MEQNYFKRTFLGIAFALAACLIWGLIFVVPQFMQGFNSLEVAGGRYFFFGLLSSFLFLKIKIQGGRYSYLVWKKAFLYSLIFAIGYYPCIVMGLRYATPAICALIMGIGPITIALYGNWREKECSFKNLIFPSLFIFIGLVMINAPAIQNAVPSTYLIGLGACLCALASWTWCVVANSRFLKQTPEISSSEWATLNGLSTFIWILFFIIGTACISSESLHLEKYLTVSPELINFLIGSAILGVICSWVGIFLWYRATLYLPVSLAGQLTVFETIFGVIYIYILETRVPPLLECAGIALFLIAIVYGIRKSSQTSTKTI